MVNNSNILVYFGEFAVEFKFNTDTAVMANVLPVTIFGLFTCYKLIPYQSLVLTSVALSPLCPLGLSEPSWLK